MHTVKLLSGICAVVCTALWMSAMFAAEPVEVRNAWIRATVPGQTVAAAYLDLTAAAPAALLGATTPIAREVELHSMEMEGGMMKMRRLASIPLPPRQTVSLKPGGHHVMLVDIKRQLKAGERIPLKLRLQGEDGRSISTLSIVAEVRPVSGAQTH